MNELAFGVFDHIERTSGNSSLPELYNERLRLLEEYDRAGIWGYHLAQHHATPLGMAPSPNLFLTAAAQHTRKLRLGTLVYLLPFYNPLRLVEEIAMLDNLSNGRAEIGVGAGVSPFELAIFRTPFYDRRDIYDDALRVIVKGLAGERLTHRGPVYRYDDVPVALHPVQRPHPGFWYGAITEQSARHAASHRMHVVTLGSLSLVKRANEVYRENLKDSAHTELDLNPNILTPRVGTTRHVYIAPNDKEAEQIARSAYQVFYDNIEHLWRQFNTTVLAFPPEYEAYREGRAIFVGSAARVRDEIAQCIEETGVDYMVLTFAWGNLTAAQARQSFDLFATRIMPEFIRQPAAAGR